MTTVCVMRVFHMYKSQHYFYLAETFFFLSQLQLYLLIWSAVLYFIESFIHFLLMFSLQLFCLPYHIIVFHTENNSSHMYIYSFTGILFYLYLSYFVCLFKQLFSTLKVTLHVSICTDSQPFFFHLCLRIQNKFRL